MITKAAYDDAKAKGLVYLAAFAPDEGQSMSDLVDSSRLPKGFLIFDRGGFIYVNPEMFWQICAQDIDSVKAEVMAATQKPTNRSILTEKSGPPAWKQLSTWYQVSQNDRIIPPATQRIFAKQMNATATISIPSSHLSPISHPNEIAQFILNAATTCNSITNQES